jgi:hypothetical protein
MACAPAGVPDQPHAADPPRIAQGAPPAAPVLVPARQLQPAESGIAPVPRAPLNPAPWSGAPATAGPRSLRVTRLLIPDLHVDAPVVDVGVQPDGQMEIPPDPRVLGRWSGGANAGELFGSLVLVGHIDTARDGPGVLFRVRDLVPGAFISAAGAGGPMVTYRVSELKRVAKDDLVTSTDPFRQDVGHRLVIITCGGPFDPRTRHYRDNLVVLADLA